MNSQVVLINQGLKAKRTFIVLTSLIPISLFLKAGFISVSVIWFFALCLYNYDSSLANRLRTGKILLLPVLLVIIHLIWIIFSPDVTAAMDLTLRKIHLVLIPLGFVVVDKKVTEKDLHILLFIFMAGCLLCSFVCYAHAISSMIALKSLALHTGGRSDYLFSGYLLTKPVNIEPIYLSLYSNLAFLVAIKTRLIKSATLKTFVGLYLALFILMIASKIGLVCLSMITITWLLTTTYKRLTVLLLGLIILAGSIGYFKSSFLSDRLSTSFKFHYTDQNWNLSRETADYSVIWGSAIETIKANPIVGYGTAGGQKALEETYRKNSFDIGIRDALNPHNEFLSATLDLGIVGAVAMAVMLFLPLIQSIRVKDTMAACLGIIFALYFGVESVLLRQKGIVFFAFFYALVLSRQVAARNEEKSD